MFLKSYFMISLYYMPDCLATSFSFKQNEGEKVISPNFGQ